MYNRIYYIFMQTRHGVLEFYSKKQKKKNKKRRGKVISFRFAHSKFFETNSKTPSQLKFNFFTYAVVLVVVFVVVVVVVAATNGYVNADQTPPITCCAAPLKVLSAVASFNEAAFVWSAS